MIDRISGTYKQAFDLAHDLARSTEKALQFECTTNDTFVAFDHFESARTGLLAGETLLHDVARMEKAYLESKSRRLEIQRTVSLLHLDPRALLDLKTNGVCEFELTERLFDFDFPGHYARQIRSLSITIPAVVGPYEGVRATLTQLRSDVLLEPDPAGVRHLLLGVDGEPRPDSRVLRTNWKANQQVAISRGVDDSGVFELDFSDERYLPFEGTGAVSRWRLEMPHATNPFDFESITDVIVHVGYTARQGGDGGGEVAHEPSIPWVLRFDRRPEGIADVLMIIEIEGEPRW